MVKRTKLTEVSALPMPNPKLWLDLEGSSDWKSVVLCCLDSAEEVLSICGSEYCKGNIPGRLGPCLLTRNKRGLFEF